ncbi:WD40-repeat-containing domain protein [Phlebopus sp. FC_14]|nr:WD40-repeat-containing domain protein [Phlebopus sp. FC_14]
MITFTDDGFSDADIKRILANRSPAISAVPFNPASSRDSLGEPSRNATIAGSSCSASRLTTSPVSTSKEKTYLSTERIPDAQEASHSFPSGVCKGKEIYRDLDWQVAGRVFSEGQREEVAYQLLASLPRSHLARIQRRIIPLLQFDLVGSLPTELSLQILQLLPACALLNCSLVSRRWNVLANDQSLWRKLCLARGWEWRAQVRGLSISQSIGNINLSTSGAIRDDRDEDEGMGDEEEREDEGGAVDAGEVDPALHEDPEREPGSMSMNLGPQNQTIRELLGHPAMASSSTFTQPISRSVSTAFAISRSSSQRHAASKASHLSAPIVPDYKLLHQTRVLLRNRIRHGSYRLRTLPGAEAGGHGAAVYCLALWTYASTREPLQVLFTGSKDRTVREWDLSTNKVRRKIVGMHASSILSLCVGSAAPRTNVWEGVDDGAEEVPTGFSDLLVSGGSDCRVVVWDLERSKPVKVLRDHLDSVLCVRIDSGRLVSCSKDRTICTYAFPSLRPQFVLRGHRAAVNAVSVAGDLVISGSGDRSVRVWDARTGALISSFDDHHARAISSVEFKPPYLLSGSSDRHVRIFDMSTRHGWSTCPEFDNPPAGQPLNPALTADEVSPAEVPLAVGRGASSFFLHSSLSQSLFQNPPIQQAHADSRKRVCSSCGTLVVNTGPIRGPERHSHPVRSVALGDEFAVSGSYDWTIKVWDRKTGALVADLAGAHTGRIFCVGIDCMKIVSCGEDQRICIWDFSHGIDTSFIKL